MAKIAIDASAVCNAHKYRGIGVYCKNYINNLHKIKVNTDITLLGNKSTEINLNLEVQNKFFHYNQIRPSWPKSRLNWLYNSLILDHELSSIAPHLYHAIDPAAIRYSKKYISVATAYDLIPLIFNNEIFKRYSLDQKIAYKRMLQNYKSVDHIIAISECTQKDFINYLKISKDKISVIPLACDLNQFDSKCSDVFIHPCGKYFLYVGSIEFRKNIYDALKAFSYARDKIHYMRVLDFQSWKQCQ